ncbi:hypothetical protein OSTOST_09311 [Ostertagia ostertagi]
MHDSKLVNQRRRDVVNERQPDGLRSDEQERSSQIRALLVSGYQQSAVALASRFSYCMGQRFTTALPYILSAAVKFIVGPISDRATCISDRWRLVFFAAASQGLMALSFLALVFVSASHSNFRSISYFIGILSKVNSDNYNTAM